MYQLPVGNIEKIRKARRAVKNILTEIGLEDCQNMLKDLNETSEKDSDEDESFKATEWFDFTDGFNGRLHKKWPYRSRSLCCSLCKYSTKNIYNFRSHISRCHKFVQSVCTLTPCSQCLFISHPKLVKKHMMYFHAKLTNHVQPVIEAPVLNHRGNERYQCRKCGFPASSIFTMKKHIILKHLQGMAEQYIGYRLHLQGTTSVKIHCCKVCRVNTGTLDQMLHHMLVEPSHYSVSTHVQGLIHENKNFTIKSTPNGNGLFVTFPNIAPKPQTTQVFNSKPLVLPSNGQAAGTVVTLQQLPGSTNSTTLICAPGTNQAFLPPQASALVQLASAEAKGLLQPGATISLRGALPQAPSMVQLPAVPNMSLKPAPVTLAPPSSQPQQTPQAQQILLPTGLQANMAAGPVSTGLQANMAAGPAPTGLQANMAARPVPTGLQANMATGPVPTGLQANMATGPVPTGLQANMATGPVPTGLQANMAAGPVPKPAVVAQNTPLNQMNLQGTMLTSQSLLSHLIPTGNKINGMPTYTFAPLQVAAPGSHNANNPLKPIEQMSNSSQQTKKWITCPLCNELFPSNVFDLHTEVAHQTKSTSAKSESLAARAAFLKKMPDKTIKCLTCKILLSEKSAFQHLLHGLNCLYCSGLFFSIRQLAEHIKIHNPSSKAYSEFLRQRYRVYTKGSGILIPYFDVSTTAPKEILGDMEVNLALVTNSLDLIFFKLQPNSQPEICPAPVKINSTYCPFCDDKFQNEFQHLQHLKEKHFVAPTIHAILKTEAFKCIYCNGVYTGKVTQQAVMLHIQRCRCSPKPPPPQPPKPAPALAQPPPKPAQQLTQPSGLYFLQVPQGLTVKQTLTPARVIPASIAPRPQESEAELKSKQRLEAALKEVIAANKREREERAAMRKKREQEKLLPPPEPVVQSDPMVKLALEPTAAERRTSVDSREFVSKYFNVNPYASKAESDELCRRLTVTKSELAALFSKKRSKCMKSLKTNTAVILLGFNMTALNKVQHNLLIPEIPTADSLDAADSPEGPAEQMEKGDDSPEPMDESGNDKVTNGEQAEQMESV
ncbi:activity-dependent neuroprotector homeobox protein 2b isoform X2 [Cheilinus undulatus]|uniref:activity-dependent neuroprotector homeobox protein 2b isoform X2 n=1 Tax=Cheilinus undulatus TaxID=241271 RepID=UPI001BD451FD|nr:activity-dependent neuroprotector homeobox protein 2b isoform X2 [Cheilinus undulatus]